MATMLSATFDYSRNSLYRFICLELITMLSPYEEIAFMVMVLVAGYFYIGWAAISFSLLEKYHQKNRFLTILWVILLGFGCDFN